MSVRWERSHGHHENSHPARPSLSNTSPATTLTTQRSDSELTCLPPGRRRRRRILGLRHRPRRLRRRRRRLAVRRRRRRDHAHPRHVQQLRLHRRAAPGVHGRAPERHDRPQQGRDVRTTPVPTTSRSSARRASPTSRPSRSTGSPRSCSTPTCSPTGPRRRQGPLARLEGSRRNRRRRQPHRLRHRHRPAGHLLPLRPVRGRRSADRPRRGRRRCFDGDWDNYFEVGRPVQGRHRQAVVRLAPARCSRA